MSVEDSSAEADARQQLHDAAERRLQRLRRMLVGTSAWAVAMLLTIAHGRGWWSAGAAAAAVDGSAAELAYWALLAGAIALAAGMLLPQILTWSCVPSGRVSDRQIRRFFDAEGRSRK
jgi:hypothetical protein